MKKILLISFNILLGFGLAALPGGVFAQQVMSVSAQDFMFSPQTMTVPVGTTVVWTNMGMMQHTVTSDNGLFDSGPLNPGATFMFTFSTPGSYPYYCRFHGGPGGTGMSGMIMVTGSGVPTNQAPVNVYNLPMNMNMYSPFPNIGSISSYPDPNINSFVPFPTSPQPFYPTSYSTPPNYSTTYAPQTYMPSYSQSAYAPTTYYSPNYLSNQYPMNYQSAYSTTYPQGYSTAYPPPPCIRRPVYGASFMSMPPFGYW